MIICPNPTCKFENADVELACGRCGMPLRSTPYAPPPARWAESIAWLLYLTALATMAIGIIWCVNNWEPHDLWNPWRLAALFGFAAAAVQMLGLGAIVHLLALGYELARKMRAIPFLLVPLLLSGCYMLSQGNWFDARAVPALQAGMTRAQVLETIGRPALAYRRDDGAEVWAYQYSRDNGIGVWLVLLTVTHCDPETHALTLAFEGDALRTVEYQSYLSLPEKGPLQVHRGQAIELPGGKAKTQGGPRR